MEMAIKVNGVEIPRRAVELEAQYHPAATAEDAFNEAAEALVVRELLMARAADLGISAPEVTEEGETEEEALIDALLEQEITIPHADEASCRRYFETHKDHFVTPTQYEPFHILYSAPQDDEELYAAAVGKAEETIKVLLADPGAFARLAQEQSACPSGKVDGSLGRVELGQTVPEFETFMINLEADQMCPVPVKTHYGVHVIRLDRIIEGRDIPFENVKQEIADYLHEASWRQAASQYVKLLVGQAKISGVAIEGAGSPLVQ